MWNASCASTSSGKSFEQHLEGGAAIFLSSRSSPVFAKEDLLACPFSQANSRRPLASALLGFLATLFCARALLQPSPFSSRRCHLLWFCSHLRFHYSIRSWQRCDDVPQIAFLQLHVQVTASDGPYHGHLSGCHAKGLHLREVHDHQTRYHPLIIFARLANSWGSFPFLHCTEHVLLHHGTTCGLPHASCKGPPLDVEAVSPVRVSALVSVLTFSCHEEIQPWVSLREAHEGASFYFLALRKPRPPSTQLHPGDRLDHQRQAANILLFLRFFNPFVLGLCVCTIRHGPGPKYS